MNRFPGQRGEKKGTSKGKLLQKLSLRFDKHIVNVLFSKPGFDFSKIAKMDKDEKFRLCFRIFDYNQDGKISVPDVLQGMKRLRETD